MDEEQLGRIFGNVAEPALARYTQARADRSRDGAWIDIMSDLVFRVPNDQAGHVFTIDRQHRAVQ